MLRILAIVLGAALFTGCGAKASPYQTITLCDFERTADPVAESPHYDIPTALKKPNYTNHDFRWNTSGYAVMEPVTKDEAKLAKNKPFYKFFQGKTAARVRFTVPADYKKTGSDKPQTWETGMTLATDSYTALPVTDWQPYHYLAFSAYNPGEKDQRLFVRIRDSSSNMTQTSAVVPAGGASILEFDLKMLEDSRLNTKDIRALTLYLDTASQAKDPVLVFDNIQLHTGTVEERRKAELDAEQGADQADEDEDWDSEDEDQSKQAPPVVSRPSGITGLSSAAASSATAAP